MQQINRTISTEYVPAPHLKQAAHLLQMQIIHEVRMEQLIQRREDHEAIA